MAEIIWTDSAVSDVDSIAEYIAVENPEAAMLLVEKLFAAVERLERHPESGRRPPELVNSRYREVICGPCRLFYRTEDRRVIIVFVMRSERDLKTFQLANS